MASPFRIFRKYMKTLLVIFGVLIMFAFVVLDPMVSYLGGGRAGAGADSRSDGSEVAVSWDGGSLTNDDLDNLVMGRRVVDSFIRGVAMTGIQLAVEAGGEPRDPRVVPLVGPTSAEQQVEQSVVQTKLFAEAARDAGMRVSDETIVAYLDELGGRRVTRDDMAAMLKQLGGGGGVPVKYVFEAIREEMLARNYLASHSFAFQTVTPEQRYEDWLRVNDRIVIEAAPIRAESFLVDVPEPSEAELVGFFNEHKEREPQPSLLVFPGGGQMEFPSPTPGFRIPRKIDVQFIEANYDEFLAKVETEITEEEIAKYYEENKDPYFIKADTDLIDEPEKPEAAEQPGEAAAPADSAEPATDTESDEAPADAGPSGESDAQTPSQDASESDADVSPDADENTGADDTEQTQPSADPPANEAAPTEVDQSSIRNPWLGGVFGLAALLQQTEGTDAPAATSTDPATTATETSAEPAATSSDGGQQPAPTDAAADATTDPPTTATSPTDAEQDTAEKAFKKKPVEYQSLDEVRDQIRGDLARNRVNEQLDTLMNQLQAELNVEWTKYFSTQLEAQAQERDAPPPQPALANLASLADKHGLKHGKTGPMSFLEFRETPVGKSGNVESQTELWRLLFGSDDLELYHPVSTEDLNANRYVIMKTSDTPGRVPELAEVRDEVVRAWKLEKAAELAQKYAADQAKNAQESRSPLSDFFMGGLVGEVVRTDPFALYTGGDVAFVNRQAQLEPFRLSEPDGIVAAGPEFMDKVFELKDGEVAAVMNHDRSIAYVVRLVEHDLSPDELRTAYLTEAATWPGMRLMRADRYQRAQQTLAADILIGAGLKWERPPDQIVRDEEE